MYQLTEVVSCASGYTLPSWIDLPSLFAGIRRPAGVFSQHSYVGNAFPSPKRCHLHGFVNKHTVHGWEDPMEPGECP